MQTNKIDEFIFAVFAIVALKNVVEKRGQPEFMNELGNAFLAALHDRMKNG